MNQVSTYSLPTYYDLELLPVTVNHSKMPPFCTFSEDIYTFEPISHFGKFEVSGYLSDSLMQKRSFSFNVEVTNSRPYFKQKLSGISLSQGQSVNYTLPEPEDRENQKILLKTYEQGSTSLPKFMSYDASSRIYQIMPNNQVKRQSYLIEISLSDSFTEENIY
jgi:antitoxin component YwqK of YwqJK toxin-antitoxin module